MDKRLLAIIFGASLAVSAFGAGSPYATSFDAGKTSHGVSNDLFRAFPNVRGTHESAIILNGTNTIASGGKHIAVTIGSALMTSSDGAFTSMQPGENIEFSAGNPAQMCLVQVIDANNALGYEVQINGFTLASASQASTTGWICRPRPMRWTADNTGSESLGGFINCNGEIWLWGAPGNQAHINFLSSSFNGSLFTVSIASGSTFGYSAPNAWTLSSTVTNASNFAGNAVENQIAISGFAKNEMWDVDDNSISHFQYGIAGWHGNPLAISNTVVSQGISSLISNKLSLVVIGTSIAATNGGFNWTNNTGWNITVFADNAGVTASAFKINGSTVYSSALGDFSAPLQNQEWISYLYSVGTPTLKYKPF